MGQGISGWEKNQVKYINIKPTKHSACHKSESSTLKYKTDLAYPKVAAFKFPSYFDDFIENYRNKITQATEHNVIGNKTQFPSVSNGGLLK